MTRCWQFGFATALASVALLASPALAEDGAPEEQPAGEEDSSPFSGIVQVDLTSAYFFRGIMNERDGWIWQPWAELYYSAYSADDGFIRDVTFGAGVWNSIHSEHTLAQDSPREFYETDWYPIVSIEFPQAVTLTAIYYFYTSANDAFDTVEELNFKLAWDDSEVLGRWALQPWINIAGEMHRTSFGDHEGEGVQMGIAPTLYEPAEGSAFPVTFTLPAELGLAMEDYYEEADGHEETFGYFSIGLAASMPLDCIPDGFGSWTVGASGKIFYLSDTLQRVNRGDASYPVVTGSLGVEF